MYAVLQEDEVIDYFNDRDAAEAEAFKQFELGNTFRLYVVDILTDYDSWCTQLIKDCVSLRSHFVQVFGIS